MPRALRSDFAGEIYHALNRGNARNKIFFKDGDFEAFERVLQEGLEKYPVDRIAYQWMSNHWHMGEASLGSGLVSGVQGSRLLGLSARTVIPGFQCHVLQESSSLARITMWLHVVTGSGNCFTTQATTNGFWHLAFGARVNTLHVLSFFAEKRDRSHMHGCSYAAGSTPDWKDIGVDAGRVLDIPPPANTDAAYLAGSGYPRSTVCKFGY